MQLRLAYWVRYFLASSCMNLRSMNYRTVPTPGVLTRLERSGQNPFNLVGFHLNTLAEGQVGEDLADLGE